MKKDEDFFEKLLYDDAKHIIVDENSKNELKNRILNKKTKHRKFTYYACLAASMLIFIAVFTSYKISDFKNFPKIIDSTKVHASQLYIKEKARLVKIIAKGNIFAPEINPEGKKILFSSEDNIFEMNIDGSNKQRLSNMKNAYSPRYSKEGDKIVFAKNDGIYIEDLKSGKVNTVIKSKNPYETFDKPNFTAEGSIIYCKTSFENNINDTLGGTKKVSEISMVDSDGKNNIKLSDGLNPALSKDGKNLAFEEEDKVYVMNIETKEKKLIDDGRQPAWSPSGNYLSYIKTAQEVIKYDKIPDKTNLYLEKQYSSIWISDMKNLGLKYKLTEEEYIQSKEDVDNWAKGVTDTSVDYHFVLSNKYTYYDSSWGNKDTDLYAVRSSEKEGFELMKFELDSKEINN